MDLAPSCIWILNIEVKTYDLQVYIIYHVFLGDNSTIDIKIKRLLATYLAYDEPIKPFNVRLVSLSTTSVPPLVSSLSYCWIYITLVINIQIFYST